MEKKISTEEGILLRGTGNVSTECFLMTIAHNVLKLHYKIQKDRLGSHLIVPKVS